MVVEVEVVVDGQLIIVPSWLQLTGPSVLRLEEVVTGVPDLLHSAGLSHTPPAQSGPVCACVCGIRGQGQPIPLQRITSHRAKYIPSPQHSPQFVRWSDVGTEDGGGLAAVQTGPPEGKTWSTLI